MWRFQDVNYAVASEADQAEILMRYCSVINAWPDDAYVQVLTNNRRIDPVEFENTMLMHLRGDAMDRLREEYNQIVREQMCIRDSCYTARRRRSCRRSFCI